MWQGLVSCQRCSALSDDELSKVESKGCCSCLGEPMKNKQLPKIILVILVCLCLGAGSVEAQSVQFTRDPVSGRVIKSEVVPATAIAPNAQVASKAVANPVTKTATTATDPVYTANTFWRANGSAFGFARASSNLTAVKSEKDKLGMTHVRYRQRHLGVKVLGADAIVHLGADGAVQTVNGQIAGWVSPRGGVNANAASQKRAIAVGMAQFAKEYGVSGVADTTIDKVIVAPGLLYNTSDKNSYVTWAVGVSAPGTAAISTVYYVDAVNARVRFREERERQLTRRVADCTANPGSGQCYSSLEVNGYHYGRREGEVSWGPNPGPMFTGNVDVDYMYDLFGTIHQYLATAYGRNGANGNGELGLNGYNYTAANVYLDALPTQGLGCTYAGYNTTYGYIGVCHTLMVPDIIAHEYAHGITNSVRLLTYYGQTGALDESYSDVFGEVFEKSYLGLTDWLNGSGVLFPGTFNGVSGLRDLKDPPASSGGGINSDPDRMYSPHMYCGTSDNGGVHWNSTILSHAAYLMSEGTPFATPFNGCTIRGIGIDKMEQVMYRANVNYYSANANFYEAYLDWNQACADLYGATSDTCVQVKRTLQAVELDQPGACSGTARVTPGCQDLCQDSDGGIDSFARGVVTDLVSGNTATDTCVIMNSSVAENYCDGDTPDVQVIQCANGCDPAIGACRPE